MKAERRRRRMSRVENDDDLRGLTKIYFAELQFYDQVNKIVSIINTGNRE